MLFPKNNSNLFIDLLEHMFYNINGDNMKQRIIFHSDLNNFYASVECLYNPSIRNKAVVVVGDQEKRHGIVLAKNYIAKAYNIKTGDTIGEATRKCGEELVCVKASFERYYYVSKIIKKMYLEYTDKVESFGIDEAWLDVTERVNSYEEAIKLADKIRARVIDEFGLTVSIGISFNKIFAKLGSDLKKPNATTLITEQNFKDVVWSLPSRELLYVGNKTEQKLEKLGIKTIGDIANTNEVVLRRTLGKNGVMLKNFALGLDDSEVKRFDKHDPIKSVGNSTTCPHDLKTNEEVKAVIYILAENVARRMREKNFWCSVVCVCYKNNELQFTEKMKTLDFPTNLASDIAKVAYKLFLENFDWQSTIRAVGVRACGLCEKPKQYNMFVNEQTMLKKENFEKVVENLRSRFGYNIITRGSVCLNSDFKELNPEHVTHIIHPQSYLKGG